MIFGLFSPVQAMAQACVFLHLGPGAVDGALFAMLNGLGIPQWLTIGLAVLAMVLTAVFFVAGADSAAIVMGSLSSRGSLEPSKPVVVFLNA